MLRSKNITLPPLDPEIERTVKAIKRKKRQLREEENMAAEEEDNTKALRDFAVPRLNDTISGILRPAIQANNFEIKPGTIQMIQTSVQFLGLPNDNPTTHIANFLEICDTFKYNGVSDDAIRLRLFPFSLRDKAKEWLHSLPNGSITTWDALAQKFLAKFVPPAKTAKLRNEITQFTQQDFESLYEAWERFKILLRRCPYHGIPEWLQIQTFYNGLNGQTRTIVDAASGGALMAKTHTDAYALLEEMAANNYQWPSERTLARKPVGVHEVGQLTALTAQVAALSRQIGQMNVNAIATPTVTCEFCGEGHSSIECTIGNPTIEQMQYVGNPRSQYRNNNNFMPNTYHPGLRNHPNFSWRNNQNVLQPQPLQTLQPTPPPPGFHSQGES